MERVKVVVGNNNFYLNKVNLKKLEVLQIDEELQEKQRKKIQKWMKDKDDYVEQQEKKEKQQLEEQKLILKAEQEKIEVEGNVHNKQYQLDLLFDKNVNIPLLYIDLKNKTKQIQCYKTLKSHYKKPISSLKQEDYKILVQDDKRILRVVNQEIIDIYNQMMDSMIEELLNLELVDENQLNNYVRIGDINSLKLLGNYVDEYVEGTLSLENIRMYDLNQQKVLFQI